MQIKTAIVIAAVAGVVLGAPAKKSECTPLFEGELEYQEFPHSKGMYQPPPEEGLVQYKDGRLEVAINATHGTKVTLERCGQRMAEEGLVPYGRVVLGDKKCLETGSGYVHAGKCGKEAEFVRMIEITGHSVYMPPENGMDWNRAANNTLIQHNSKDGDRTKGLSLEGKLALQKGDKVKCTPVYTDVLLQYSDHEGRAMVGFEGDKVVLGKKGARVTLEACVAQGFKDDIYGAGGRARAGDKCITLERGGEKTATLEKCAESGKELEAQWFNAMENLDLLSKDGKKAYWKRKGNGVAEETDDVKGGGMIYKEH